MKKVFSPFILLCATGMFATFSSTISENPVLPLFTQSLCATEYIIGLIAAFSTIVGIVATLPAGFGTCAFCRLVDTRVYIAELWEFGEPARKALIIDLAGQEGLGRRMGVYYMVRGISMSAAPFVVGVLYGWNPMAPFVTGGLVSGTGLLVFVLEGLIFAQKRV